jgi:hypothetical protein
MKKIRAIMMTALIAAGGLSGSAAWADRGHYRGHWHGAPHHHYGGGGLVLGTGLLLGSALVWAVSRPPPVVVAPQPVVVAPPPAPRTEWWYYCRSAGAYYPYVQNCASGWEAVPAQPY